MKETLPTLHSVRIGQSQSNDPNSFKEVLAAHLMTVNKVELAKKVALAA